MNDKIDIIINNNLGGSNLTFIFYTMFRKIFRFFNTMNKQEESILNKQLESMKKDSILTLEMYQKLASRTCPTNLAFEGCPQDIVNKLNLSHMVMGICSETNELLDAIAKEDSVNISEELADKLWYIANYCTFRNIELSSLKDIPYDVHLVWYESELTDYVKKYVAYNKEIDKLAEFTALSSLVHGIKKTFILTNITLEQALTNNINKLKVRYPDKFNDNDAVNRNLEAERKELEKQ